MKIHIIGGPGSGKTYLAEKLSKELGIQHYDLDELQWDNKSDSYGIKIAGNRLAERYFAVSEALFDGALRHAVLEKGERAGIVALHQRCFKRVIAIEDKGAAVFDNGDTFFSHILLIIRIILL